MAASQAGQTEGRRYSRIVWSYCGRRRGTLQTSPPPLRRGIKEGRRGDNKKYPFMEKGNRLR